MKTTAIYRNRIFDKKKVETELGLKEFGDDSTIFFTTKYTPIFCSYNCIIYGDHGPYVEFNPDHLICDKVVNKFNSQTPKDAYYEWKTILDGSNIKIYWQLRDVKNLPNPPSGGYRGNRKEGYADYKPGKFYVSPWEMYFKPNISLDKPRSLNYIS